MADPRTEWNFSGSYFYEIVQDDYQQRFDGEQLYTKDIVLGATSSADSYIDLGAFVVAPMTKTIEFGTVAGRQTFQALIGTTATLANNASTPLSYTATLVKVTRIEGAVYPRAIAVWEAR